MGLDCLYWAPWGGLLRKETFQTSPPGSRKPQPPWEAGVPYLKVSWGLFHFLPVRA